METWLKDKLRGDWQIWFIIVLLSLFSMLVVYSASSALAYKKAGGNTESYLLTHTAHLILGLIVVWVIHRINYTNYAGISKVLLWITPFLLLYTYFFGTTVGGTKRWINLFGVSFQSSDLVRLVLITNLAAMLARRQNVEYTRKTLIELIFWCVLLCGMLAVTNFSTAVILGVTCFLIMFVGRVPSRYLFRMSGLVISILILMISISVYLYSTGVEFGRGQVVLERIEAFSNIDINRDKIIGNPERDDSFQKEQAMIAIARGGTIGIGPGNSFQRNYLPEAFSDYIYAIIVEEYGLVGAVMVMGLYLWLLYRGLKNVENTNRAFGGLLCVGLTFSIVFQAFVHMFINVGLGPVTGQTLPLMSMGGTSILFTSVAIGIVLSVTKGEYDEKSIQ
ncbi:putative peptidoglycan glycosyltransferase FtsW [Emticicia aquatica]|uniref:Probable peptidoglycan glycosyltransferase FtsW n=1 Tax=Emticicia aquatica TaxID=1681835 RepID=A0ABN8EUP8_9BACT|nr:FtsW/RodA/SpoVE family cell cycle protein [Emticicia aquatica]CAH0996767.1 putative peptidoglycan glycosyltransferase FtsW [Emticicia aquatica]